MARFTVPSKYLSHTDISDVTDTVLTVKSYEKTIIGQQPPTEKWVLYFEETQKGLVLNKTNGKTMTKLFLSDDMDSWIGGKVSLYVKDDVEFQGEIMSAIRIRTKRPKEVAV